MKGTQCIDFPSSRCCWAESTGGIHCCFVDRWWNPAVENQAIARAHRMGRTEPVHAIKFITSETIEEKMIKFYKIKQIF